MQSELCAATDKPIDPQIFEISETSKRVNKTELRFTHKGLVPRYECFEICSNAWTHYVQQSLAGLVNTGKGMPNGKDKPSTEDEKKIHAESKM